MNSKRLANLAKMRKKSIAEEKARKEEETKRKIARIEASLKTINKFYSVLTDGCDEDDKTIEASPCLASRNSLYFPSIEMSEKHGLRMLCIAESGHEEICFVIGSRGGAIASLEKIIQKIWVEATSDCPEWIFEHGDEFCEKMMDDLEKQYKTKRDEKKIKIEEKTKMNKEKLKRVAEMRNSAIAQEKKRKEKSRQRKLEAVAKGAEAIDEMYRVLTAGCDKDSRIVKFNGEDEQGRTFSVCMSEGADGVLVMNIHQYAGREDVSIRLSSRDAIAYPEDILASIAEQRSPACAEWIFEHGDEFCENALTWLEEHYGLILL